MESLVLAGALEYIARSSRAAVRGAGRDLRRRGSVAQGTGRTANRTVRFGGIAPIGDVELPEVSPFSAAQTLEYERELMGLYLSGHPLDEYDELAEQLQLDRLVDQTEAPDGQTVLIAGMIVSLKPFVTRKGQAMAFLESKTGL